VIFTKEWFTHEFAISLKKWKKHTRGVRLRILKHLQCERSVRSERPIVLAMRGPELIQFSRKAIKESADLVERKSRNMNRTLRNEARELSQQGQQAQPVLITETHLLALPAVMQRYLRYSQVIGKESIRTVRLKQLGKFRQSARQPWMKLDAEEYYSVNPPGFLWVGTMRKGGFPLVRARDRYRDGKGNMQIKLGTVLTIANATGAAMDQASMTRYFNEMMWFPTAFLEPNVSFEPVDQTSAKVTLTDSGKQVTATMYFDDQGRPTDFVAPRYYREGLETWSTPITEYGEFGGFKLPVKAKAVWKLKEGDFEYIDVVITDLEYNVTTPY